MSVITWTPVTLLILTVLIVTCATINPRKLIQLPNTNVTRLNSEKLLAQSTASLSVTSIPPTLKPRSCKLTCDEEIPSSQNASHYFCFSVLAKTPRCQVTREALRDAAVHRTVSVYDKRLKCNPGCELSFDGDMKSDVFGFADGFFSFLNVTKFEATYFPLWEKITRCTFDGNREALTSITIENCGITHIDGGAFACMFSLRNLVLRRNKISEIQPPASCFLRCGNCKNCS